jgi:hypothetical protein
MHYTLYGVPADIRYRGWKENGRQGFYAMHNLNALYRTQNCVVIGPTEATDWNYPYRLFDKSIKQK